MIDADEWFPGAVREQRHGTVGLIANDAEVAPGFVNRPPFDPSESVGRHQLGRINEMGIIPGAHGAVAPPVIPMPGWACVVEIDVLLENRAAGIQPKFYAPL